MFGELELNNSYEQVLKKLGEPEGYIAVTKPLKSIHYGCYEFVFDASGLKSIQNDRFNPDYPELMEFENDTLCISPGVLEANKSKNMQDIEQALKDLGIDYTIIDYWGRKALKTHAQIVIDFNDEEWSAQQNNWLTTENTKDYKLIGFRYELVS